MGCIGGGDLTPNIDALAEKSVLFTNAISNGPGTPQSFPSIFASVYPLMNESVILSRKFITLAQILNENGFLTAGFHSNPFLSKFFGWNRGFDIFQDLSDDLLRARLFKKITQSEGISGFLLNPVKKALRNKLIKYILKKVYSLWMDNPLPYKDGKRVNKAVINFLKENSNQRFFLWVHYMDPHEPYFPPEHLLDSISPREVNKINLQYFRSKLPVDEELVMRAKQLYDMEVKYADYCVGKLIDKYEELGLMENTLIVLTADHGESFLEHGERGHPHHSLYDELLRVPLIIYGIGEKKKVTEPVQLLDISPTILAILGIKKPKTFQGNFFGFTSETGIISESAKFGLENFTYDLQNKVISYRTKKWKLIFHQSNNRTEFFDLEKDPGERKNVLNDNKDLAREYTRQLQLNS